jgi:putative transposase
MSVFLDETGVLLGLTRTHASNEALLAYAVKSFYRAAKVTVIGAISLKRVVALMTMDNSMDSQAFEVFTLEMFSATIVVGSSSSYG